MRDDTFVLTQSITGQPRKIIAGTIAKALDAEVRYQGPPDFAYSAEGWSIDKNGAVSSPEIEFSMKEELMPMLIALKESGLLAKGDLLVRLSGTSHTGATVAPCATLSPARGN